ncbi:MAG: LPS export ABC transporter periplasmic protein LptC [Halanaerobiaceae bacterium]
MKKALITVIILVIILFPPVTAAQEEGNGDEESSTVQTRADKLEYADDMVVLKDNVEVIRGENRITADRAELYREEDKAELWDNINAEYSQGTVTSRELTAFMDEDRYEFREEVVLKHRTEEGEEMTLETPLLELFTDDNSFDARDGVVIDFQDRTVRSEKADYDGETEILTMVENVEIEDEGDWIKSERAEFDLGEEDVFSAEGAVELEFEVD